MDKPPERQFWFDLIHRCVDLITPTPADIWTSPAKIGILIELCRTLEPIGKEAETTGINLALQKHDIPGFSLVRRERNGYVEATTVAALLLSVPVKEFVDLLPKILSWSGNVSEKRYRELCELLSRPSDEPAIKRAGDSVFLRQLPLSQQQPNTER